jgi:hypothetical protein
VPACQLCNKASYATSIYMQTNKNIYMRRDLVKLEIDLKQSILSELREADLLPEEKYLNFMKELVFLREIFLSTVYSPN